MALYDPESMTIIEPGADSLDDDDNDNNDDNAIEASGGDTALDYLNEHGFTFDPDEGDDEVEETEDDAQE